MFFADVIMLGLVFNIEPTQLKEIYEDVEKFTKQQCLKILKLRNLSFELKRIETFFNEILGSKQYIFHGTTSLQKDNFKRMQNCVKHVKPYVLVINKIYESHGIFLAFQNGIKDCDNNNFWVTTSASSACFYALQSPEFFARFASRSDYYKVDIFKYDRIAYYRKDYSACAKNLLTEMSEFNFSDEEQQIVLVNFKKIWDIIVNPDMKSTILYTEIVADNKHYFKKNLSPYKMLLQYFTKVHFTYDLKEFIRDTKKIILPDVTQHLKTQNPKIDKKFIMIENKKIYPDFYINHKYAEHSYFCINGKGNIFNLETKQVIENKKELINFINLAKPNSQKAEEILIKNHYPSIEDVTNYYRLEFKKSLKHLKQCKKQTNKIKIVNQIANDVGIKYISSKIYNKYIKDIGHFEIYELRKLLGIKMLEHYDGYIEITDNKIAKLQDIYETILHSPDTILSKDLVFKIYKQQIEIVK